MISVLLAVFSGIALLLAAIGIYGVISNSVAHRTSEMGIRAALGASPQNLLHLVLQNGIGMTGAGLILGIAGALALPRMLAAILSVSQLPPVNKRALGRRAPETLGLGSGKSGSTVERVASCDGWRRQVWPADSPPIGANFVQ